ncbi:MAG: hypothetical protein U1E60_21835 [Reyranellaceae bacterium]
MRKPAVMADGEPLDEETFSRLRQRACCLPRHGIAVSFTRVGGGARFIRLVAALLTMADATPAVGRFASAPSP